MQPKRAKKRASLRRGTWVKITSMWNGIYRTRTRKFSRACVGAPRRGFFATMYATNPNKINRLDRLSDILAFSSEDEEEAKPAQEIHRGHGLHLQRSFLHMLLSSLALEED
ncbi:hypothetical protein GN958_ATG10554 [Phytophthora infestans]|uniref:Uncharacterized protein n=1 Tax=Phytophthora infestans TaxID=4787 RepID=A0A8S9UMJ2_PHYIN|nr:hypothetical protein GN958_ATG10554 [Phytophthora infestans]